MNKNENIRGKLEVAQIEDELKENRLRQFLHVHRGAIDTTLRRIDCLEVTSTLRESGIKLKQKQLERALRTLDLTEWKRMIHLADKLIGTKA